MKKIQSLFSKIRAAAGRAPKPAVAATLLLAAVGACNMVGSSGPAAVNSDRMRNANSEANVDDWMSYGRTCDEQRFSPLDQINDSNVDQLGLAWYDDLDTCAG